MSHSLVSPSIDSAKWCRWGMVGLAWTWIVIVGHGLAQRPDTGQVDKASPVPQSDIQAALALEQVLMRAISEAEASVVAIARGVRGQQRDLVDPQFVPHEYASGVIVDKNGLVLTNYHSLGNVSTSEYVIWHQNKFYSKVRVKAADPWTDLAVLECDARNWKPIELADGETARKGQIVLALGNPHAIARDGNVSASWGIISNVARKVDGPQRAGLVDNQERETRYQFGALIQTDVRLGRGNSGGPLLNLDGKMIGLMTTIGALAGFQRDMNFAIPVDNRFRQVLEKLKRGEEVGQGFLGVMPRNQVIADQIRVVLDEVKPGTPAYLAGLREHDELLQIDGQTIQTMDDLFLNVSSLPPGHVMQVRLRRVPDGERTIPVRITKKPAGGTRPVVTTADVPRWRGMAVDYGTALSLAKISQLDPLGCVIVTDVTPDSPAWIAGLRQGSLISRVGGEQVTSPDDFFRIVTPVTGTVEITLFEIQGYQTIQVE